MSMAVMPKLATQHKSLAGGENMKTIIIEMDENKKRPIIQTRQYDAYGMR